MGCQPSASSAARATFFGPRRGDHDRDAHPDRVVDQLERLAEAGAAVQGERVVPPVVVEALAPQTIRQISISSLVRPTVGVVGHAVPALDHLRAAGAEAERGTGRRRRSRARPRSSRSAPGSWSRWGGMPEAISTVLVTRRDEASWLDRVEAVRLGDEDDLQAGPLEVGELADRLGGTRLSS